MEKNKIYIGSIHKEPVKFVGIIYHDELKVDLHQFEYVIPKDKIIGYGQNKEQVLVENYKLAKLGTLLYER